MTELDSTTVAGGLTAVLLLVAEVIFQITVVGMIVLRRGTAHAVRLAWILIVLVLPLVGAIVTHSAYGRRYASGLFQEGDTRMYVNRGLGFEGSWLPRARFLCRPEIASIELAAGAPQSVEPHTGG